MINGLSGNCVGMLCVTMPRMYQGARGGGGGGGGGEEGIRLVCNIVTRGHMHEAPIVALTIR